MKKQTRRKKYFERLFHKYRLSVLDEYTLEEAFHMRASRLGFNVLIFFAVLILFVLFGVLFLYTPLKRLSPWYADSEVRAELIQESMRLDSISNVVKVQRNQMEALRVILSGDIPIDTALLADEHSIIENDFLQKGEREASFCSEYETRERYNLSSIAEKKSEDVPIFFRPIKGVVKRAMEPNEKHFGCDVVASVDAAVVSVYEGTIVFTEYTTMSEYVVGIVHKGGYMSVYKNNAKVIKQVGENVKTGEAIAFLNSSEGTSKPYLHFELWRDGAPLNPLEYISF